MPRVVITLPAYRAERTLEQTVAEIPPGVADRIILVDDASPDNTAQVARELGIEVHVHRQNLGYGGNQKTCYIEALASGADVVVLLHPDYQYEPKAVPLLIAPILAGDADMTFGSRFAGLGDPIGGGMPVYRYVGNRLTTIAENLMLGSRFSELHSGLRAYTRRCLLSLPILGYSDDFLFDSQLLIDAVTTGQRVVEVPIPTRYTKESSSIAVDRSLEYIAGTLGYCARSALMRGRRGRRVRLAGPASPAPIHTDPRGDPCPACGAATETAIGQHDSGVRCTSCGLVSFSAGRSFDTLSPDVRDGTDAEAVFDSLGAYYAPGNRLLVLGHGDDAAASRVAQERGWTVVHGGPPRPHEHVSAQWPSERRDTRVADAVLLRDADASLPNALADLTRARSSLHLEGLLLVTTRISSPADGIDRDYRRYLLTRNSVRMLLTRAGFEIVEWGRLPRRLRAGALLHRVARSELVVARPAHRR